MRKILTLIAALSLVATLAVGGSIAYLQDSENTVNVMTLGNVDIEIHEYERVTDENGDYTTIDVDGTNSYELKEYTQGKPLYPYVGEVNSGYDSTEVRLGQLGHNSRGGMSVFPAKNVQDKFVVIENTGKSDAYVRTIVAFEVGDVSYEDFTSKYPTYMVNYLSHFTWDEPKELTEFVKIGDSNYWIVEFIYKGYEDVQHPNGVLTPGDYTYNSLAQVYMAKEATNEDVKALDGNHNGSYDILVASQAVQAMGFADAKTALDEAFGEITATNHPWVNNAPIIPIYAYNAKQLADALANGGNVIVQDDITTDGTITVPKGVTATLNLNGKTITNEGTGYGIRNNGTLTVTGNGTIQGDFGALSAYGDLTVENGTFISNGTQGKTHHCLYIGSNGHVVVNGGSFAHNGAGVSDSGATVTIYDYDNDTNTTATLVVNGGTFTGSGTYIRSFDNYGGDSVSISFKGGTFSTDPSKYVAAGYTANKNDNGTWTVKAKPVTSDDINNAQKPSSSYQPEATAWSGLNGTISTPITINDQNNGDSGVASVEDSTLIVDNSSAIVVTEASTLLLTNCNFVVDEGEYIVDNQTGGGTSQCWLYISNCTVNGEKLTQSNMDSTYHTFFNDCGYFAN